MKKILTTVAALLVAVAFGTVAIAAEGTPEAKPAAEMTKPEAANPEAKPAKKKAKKAKKAKKEEKKEEKAAPAAPAAPAPAGK